MNLQDMRENYTKGELLESEISQNPIQQFAQWMEFAVANKVKEPNAMQLATVSKLGQPTIRTVLLKNFDKNGFTFFTNYLSRKANEIQDNNHVALQFVWLDLERQIRIEGTTSKLTNLQSKEYFKSRPRESQLAAWASPQSDKIEKISLKKRLDRYKNEFEHYRLIPKPDFWGGYVVKPHLIEFWQGRESRLHDRIQYELNNGIWLISRLAP
ncbi:MAG: pyridoxamine 5'-phosphate oxidase [Bacteroidota bacterium]|nr:pyridoxamine 5'-phosphate oxidase [Bacteroidota bacterium]